ncbi:uncharacterized protein [Porites lutea]|uniref:uncharacterized protein isoform X2 n=1 Tax=Porites lutea TaxID=51062 RepID=UPI003CC5890E
MDSPTGNDQSGSSAKEAETLPDATGAGGDDLDHSKRPSNDTGTEENSSTRDNTGDSAENPKSEEEKPSNVESSSMRSTDEDAAVNVNSESSAGLDIQHESKPKPSFNTKSTLSDEVLLDHILGTIYGNCIGDAIGLLTEFMTKKEAMHMDPVDYAGRLKKWSREGFKELGDMGGMGIGSTTHSVLRHPQFLTNPHEAARYVWEYSGRYLAPNGGVMRTSILGIHDFGDIDTVISNTMAACKVTHADPRCIASCVAVTTAVAIMLQGKHMKQTGEYDVEAVVKEAYEYACTALESKQEKEDLKEYMFAKSLNDLQLDESGKIGYTYKCMGAGFWALRQENFRDALEAIAFEGGDADTNGAVAGALLGCKLGASALPTTWRNGLKYKDWLDGHIGSFLALLGLRK